MSRPLYEIYDLKQRYEKGKINLDIARLTIKDSRITGIVGPNGSGKSTLLKLLAFLIPADGGRIIFDGKDTAGRENAVRREATYLLQEPYLLKRSVYENIAYGLKLRGEVTDIGGRVRESLKAVGLDYDEFAGRPWFRLSGGEAQRVALAARLALRPKALLLDEPTANVDEASAQLVMEAAVNAVKERGTAVIIATHDLSWLYEMSGEVVSLYGGRVAGRGAENLIQGGWMAEGALAARELGGGQRIFAYLPRSGSPMAAMLSADDVSISTEEPPRADETNTLRGRVLQMTLEGASASTLLSIEVGGGVIRGRVRLDDPCCAELHPAREVYISFRYSALRWI
ncbi:MAG: energy-coupling factor ABC transporter ATP-binding protein [Synergistaceae bacterium]|nr:energy-coupling factor ABC transporter ATP-binding protein [Synergistaceae bacterium]